MNNTDSIAHLVAAAVKVRHIQSPCSLALRIPHSSRIWPAEVITRWAGGCHVRVAGEHDTMLAPDALPEGVVRFGIRITRDGIVVLPA